MARTYAAVQQGLTRFVKAESPVYTNDSGNDVLFPFSYSNQVLDISYAGNNFKESMVDSTGNSPESETDTIYRIIGVPRLVTSLGDNFKAYIRAWRDGSIDSGSPIELYMPSQVLRVQEGSYDNITSTQGDSYIISETAPASDNYITGSAANKYSTTYVFKTPLTFTIIESGTKKYIKFRTAFDQE